MSSVEFESFPWPLADEEILAALEQAYHDGSWGVYLGPNCEGLVDDLREYFAVEHTMLCSSGTIGVELALRGCGVERGDRVALAGYDFPGNFRAIDAIGARAVLVDVCRDSWSMDADSLDQVSTDGIKAVIVSHLHGGLADMPRIVRLCRERGWKVVEDACQQPGADLSGCKVGTWGDVGVLSFGGSKLLTAGRGGAVITDDTTILQRMRVFSEQGNQAFPLSELQAAVLRPQLKKLDARNSFRAENVAVLREETRDLEPYLRPVCKRQDASHAYYKFAWSLVPAEQDPAVREDLVARLQRTGAPLDVGFRGFVGRGVRRCEKPVPLDNSAALSQSTILLHHPILLAHKKTALQLARLLVHEVQQLAG